MKTITALVLLFALGSTAVGADVPCTTGTCSLRGTNAVGCATGGSSTPTASGSCGASGRAAFGARRGGQPVLRVNGGPGPVRALFGRVFGGCR